MEMPKPGEFVFDPELKQEVTTVPWDVYSAGGRCQRCPYSNRPLCGSRPCVGVVYLTKNDYLTAKMLGML